MTKSRECSSSCLEYLNLELVRHYQQQKDGPSLQSALQAIGYRVGQQMVERVSRERALLSEPLEIMKFICKELWPEVFQKSIDNLRTNHRGTFVLRDVQFRWLSHLHQNQLPAAIGDPVPAPIPRAELAADYLHLPCAILEGALCTLGLETSITADAAQLPQCDFTVVLKQAGAQ